MAIKAERYATSGKEQVAKQAQNMETVIYYICTRLNALTLGINKANAIKKVCEKLSITMEEVLACGDSINDLAMIREAGVGVAMGNAQPIIKEEADWVTSSQASE